MTFEELCVRVERGEMVVIAVDMEIADRLRIPLLAQVWIEPHDEDRRIVELVLHEPDE